MHSPQSGAGLSSISNRPQSHLGKSEYTASCAKISSSAEELIQSQLEDTDPLCVLPEDDFFEDDFDDFVPDDVLLLLVDNDLDDLEYVLLDDELNSRRGRYLSSGIGPPWQQYRLLILPFSLPLQSLRQFPQFSPASHTPLPHSALTNSTGLKRHT